MPTRLLLISDTHIPGRARTLPDAVRREADASDLIIHAGDWVSVSVLDDLERALEAAEEHDEVKLVDGVRLVQQALRQALEREGLADIEADGKFDPHVHEALLAQAAEEAELEAELERNRVERERLEAEEAARREEERIERERAAEEQRVRAEAAAAERAADRIEDQAERERVEAEHALRTAEKLDPQA